MTHRGPFQPLLFCDSVTPSWQPRTLKRCCDARTERTRRKSPLGLPAPFGPARLGGERGSPKARPPGSDFCPEGAGRGVPRALPVSPGRIGLWQLAVTERCWAGGEPAPRRSQI